MTMFSRVNEGSGSINLREFIAGLSVMTRGTPEEKMDRMIVAVTTLADSFM